MYSIWQSRLAADKQAIQDGDIKITENAYLIRTVISSGIGGLGLIQKTIMVC